MVYRQLPQTMTECDELPTHARTHLSLDIPNSQHRAFSMYKPRTLQPQYLLLGLIPSLLLSFRIRGLETKAFHDEVIVSICDVPSMYQPVYATTLTKRWQYADNVETILMLSFNA